jgi:hypothetical protein
VGIRPAADVMKKLEDGRELCSAIVARRGAADLEGRAGLRQALIRDEAAQCLPLEAISQKRGPTIRVTAARLTR